MLQAVAHQQHGGARAEHAARPQAVEVVQAQSDARAARPVLDAGGALRHGDVGVALAQQRRQAGEPGAEGKGLHLGPGLAQQVGKVQQHARVARHRARHVGQHHQRRHHRARPAVPQRQEITAHAAGGTQRGAHVQPAGPRAGFAAARGQRRQCQLQPREQAQRLAELVVAHGLEVGLLQPLLRAGGERGLELDLSRRRRLGRCVARGRKQRVSQAPVFLDGRRRVRVHARQQQRAHAAGEVGVAPVQREGLVEQRLLLVAAHEAGREHGVEVGLALQAGHRQRPQRQLHAVGAHGQARGAQHAGKVHHVLGQPAGRLAARQHGFRRAASRPGVQVGHRRGVPIRPPPCAPVR